MFKQLFHLHTYQVFSIRFVFVKLDAETLYTNHT